jgi:dethiobiotin synthetase
MELQPQSYFITGTDTDVGKTYIASKIIEHFVKAGYKTIGMKPVAAGCEVSADGLLLNDDVTALCQASNVSAPAELINPYLFEPAIAPHIAAAQKQVDVLLSTIVSAYQALDKSAELVIVEGAGGFFVPLNDSELIADLAAAINLPIVLVVGMKLGCINHALLTVEAIRAKGLTLAGWVANQIDPDMAMIEENLQTLKKRIDAPLIMHMPWGG